MKMKDKKIAIASDPAGFPLKEALRTYLEQAEYPYVDLGTRNTKEPVNYIEAASNVARVVSEKEADFGVVCCGTGMGVSIVANKHKGVYCALVESEWAAHEARNLNDANVIAMGNRIVAPAMACDILKVFLETPFAEGASEERKRMLEAFLEKLFAEENVNMR